MLNIVGYILFIWNIVNFIVTGMYLPTTNQNMVYNIMVYAIFTHCIHVLEPIGMGILYRNIKIYDHPFNVDHVLIMMNNGIACLAIPIILNHATDVFYIYTISYICCHYIICFIIFGYMLS